MNTSLCLDANAPPTRRNWRVALGAWLQTVRKSRSRWLLARQARPTELDLSALDGLSAETLKDIGAPEWLQERMRSGRWSAIDPAYWR